MTQLGLPPRRVAPGRPGTSRSPLPLAAAIGIAALLVLFLVWPVLLAIGRGFVHDDSVSTYWFVQVANNPLMVEQAKNSLLLACTTTLVSLVIALPLAMLRGRCRFRGQGVLGMLVLVPMILPPFVGALSMQRLFSQYGSINLLLRHLGVLDFAAQLPPDWLGTGFTGVVLLQSLHLFPILYLNASAALANIDPAYSQASRNLGAGPVRTFFRVTLPLMRPGLFAGGTIVFIWALTDIGTPLIIGYEALIPVTIFKEIARGDVGGWTYSLVFLMLSGAVSLYVLGKFVFGMRLAADTSKASIAGHERPLGLLGTAGAWAAFGAVISLAILPHVGVILMATSAEWVNTVLPTSYTTEHLRFVVTQPVTFNSILNSVRYASVSTGLDMLIGLAIAWLIVRSRVVGRGLLDGLAMLPLAVPGLILAAGYVVMTAPGTTWERIGPMGNPFAILVIAYAVRRLPFVVRGASAGLQQVPEALEEAARNLGASRTRAAVRITLPLIAANLIAAGVLVFTFAMLEVSDSLVLAQREQHFPITKQIYNLATSTGSPQTASQAAALGVFGMLLLGGTMATATALLGRRLGAIFRA